MILTRPKFHLLVALCAMMSSPALAVDLYSNGPLGTGPTAKNGTAAPAGTQWSEVQNDAGNLLESNTVAGFSVYRNAAATTDFAVADNFTITDPGGWQVDSFRFFAYRTGNNTTTSPFARAFLQIWNGRPGDPGSSVVFGDLTTNRLASSTFDSKYRIFNTVAPPPGTATGTTRPIWANDVNAGVVLAPGSYWVEWTYNMTTDSFTSFSPSVTIVDSRGQPGWNGRQRNGLVWQDLVDAGNPATAADVIQDMPFIVRGTVIPEPSSMALLLVGVLALLARRR